MSYESTGGQDNELHPLNAIVIVVAVSAAAFAIEVAIAQDLPWGEEARGVAAVLLGAITALWLTVRKGGSLAALGLTRPRSWWTVPFWVLGIFFTFVFAQALVPQLIAPVFDLPAPDMSRYDFIRADALAAISMALLLPLTAAIPEELVYRGFLIRQFERLYGNVRAGPVLAVLSQALIFGFVHFQWGLGGIVMTSIMGFVWGVAYLLCGRNLWIVIMAHSLAHIALILQLYSAPVPA
ncbi:MAG: CPBP family intramembrane metalloprotease [Gammaproteobacteria bacterium]|nr:CPBP family intramembrane metalloprotease [Gammaproteobacteria bacterium]